MRAFFLYNSGDQTIGQTSPYVNITFGGTNNYSQYAPSSSSNKGPAGQIVGQISMDEEQDHLNNANHKRKKSTDTTKPSKKAAEASLKVADPDSVFAPPAVPAVPVVSAVSNTPQSLLSASRIAALTALPVNLLKAFNGGDIQKVREIVRDFTLKNCALRTPALDTELFGQNYVSAFFESVYDSHPDAVWVAKKSKFIPERSEVSSRVYFAGTRIASASKGTDLSGAYSDHLFKRRGSSLLDEMDVSALTEAEIHAMKELENLGCNLSVFGKGTMTLLIDEESGKISKFSCMWVITSFRQATI